MGGEIPEIQNKPKKLQIFQQITLNRYKSKQIWRTTK
jgi:hypothetical protein